MMFYLIPNTAQRFMFYGQAYYGMGTFFSGYIMGQMGISEDGSTMVSDFTLMGLPVGKDDLIEAGGYGVQGMMRAHKRSGIMEPLR